MTAARTPLVVVRGVVTACKEQMHYVRVDRKIGHGHINRTPELWLHNASGKEHQYQGGVFEAAQPGHDVVVIIKTPFGKPLALANFTSEVVHDGADLTASTTIGATLISPLVSES